MIACGYMRPALNSSTISCDAGPLLVERRVPQPPLHVPGQVELAGALGEQVMRDAGLMRAGPAEERPGVDGELAPAAGAQVRRAEPAARAAADEDGVVLPVVLLWRGDVPQAFGVLLRVRDDVVDQQGPLAHGKRSTGRSPVPAGQRAQGADAGTKRREPVIRISYIDHRRTSAPMVFASTVWPAPCCLPVQDRQWCMGGAGHLRTKNSPGIAPPDQWPAGRPTGNGRGAQDSSRSACSVPQARVASCRLKWTSGSLSSSPVRSRIRCSRYFSVLLCTESSAAVAS